MGWNFNPKKKILTLDSLIKANGGVLEKAKKVYIVGAGLYGCLTAWKIKKYMPSCEVNLIDSSDHVLSVFDSIKLGDKHLNNGFHGIELPRAKKLYEFLLNDLGFALKKQDNLKKILISGVVVDYVDKLESYPDNIKRFFRGNNFIGLSSCQDIFNSVTEEYKTTLKMVSRRYSDNINDVIHLLVPWYFPADFTVPSDDEGDLFRDAVRSKQIYPEYSWPETYIFADLQSSFQKILKGIGVNVLLNTKVDILQQSISLNSKESIELVDINESVVFFCAPPLGILKYTSPDTFSKLTENPRFIFNALIKTQRSFNAVDFTEILCCDQNVPALARISSPFPGGGASSDYIQLEIFEKNDSIENSSTERVVSYIAEILASMGYANASLVGSAKTRTVFFPGCESIDEAIKHVRSWAGQFSNMRVLESFGPINMAKTWDHSEENLNFYKEVRSH